MILIGDVLEQLATLEADSVQCVVTSPPYWGLRDYGVEGMIGLEPTLAEHIAKLVAVFGEVRRVVRPDGVVWLNYGDAYAGARVEQGVLAPKQRLLLPARVALALQADGWWVRSEIVWAKGVSFCPAYSGSCMPSSVRDRPTDSHEMVYLLTKRARYFYDADAVREASSGRDAGNGFDRPHRIKSGGGNPTPWTAPISHTRNIRTVWTINPKGYKEAHFATFPEALVRPCILAGTSGRGACAECGAPWRRVVDRTASGAGSGTTGWQPTCDHTAPVRPCVVLDPFAGSGTTGAVAVANGCSFIGIELNPEYAELARKRISRAELPLFNRRDDV